MEVLKPLEEVCEADSRHEILGNFDPDETLGDEGDSLRSRHARMARLELSGTVPETIRSAYAVARTLWLYGWFYWPFYTLAEVHACLCVDLALYHRGVQAELINPNAEKAHKAHPSLRQLFQMAIEQNWLADDAFEHVRMWEERAQVEEPFLSDEGTAVTFDNRRYVHLLAETIPNRRDMSVHPPHYSHGMPSDLLLQNVRDIIEQLAG